MKMAREVANNFLLAFSWIALLVCGFMVSSQNCLDSMGGSVIFDVWWAIVFCASWTLSNLVMLSVVSCYIGIKLCKPKDEEPEPMSKTWQRATLNGIAIFGILFFGAGWVDVALFLEPTQEGYFKLASLAFFGGMATGFDPSIIERRIKPRHSESSQS